MIQDHYRLSDPGCAVALCRGTPLGHPGSGLAVNTKGGPLRGFVSRLFSKWLQAGSLVAICEWLQVGDPESRHRWPNPEQLRAQDQWSTEQLGDEVAVSGRNNVSQSIWKELWKLKMSHSLALETP